MIDRSYCRTMARYNAWQNKTLWDVVQTAQPEVLEKDSGLGHGSVLGTLNHALWLDQMWLSRLFKVKPPTVEVSASASLTPDLAAWWAERFRADGALRMWADTLSTMDLQGEIAFWSISSESDVIVSRNLCVLHMFNQQTDLRAQVRLVLAQAGHTLPPTALFLLPKK